MGKVPERTADETLWLLRGSMPHYPGEAEKAPQMRDPMP